MTKKPAAEKADRILGFCWFRREDYDRARSLMADPEILFDTWEEWFTAARKIEREVTERGEKVVRIRFDLAAFMLWCVGHDRLPDEKARAAWAADAAKRKFGHR
ncbi:MAG: hypothetical protein ABTQ29_05120 [Siculibacillus sp.]